MLTCIEIRWTPVSLPGFQSGLFSFLLCSKVSAWGLATCTLEVLPRRAHYFTTRCLWTLTDPKMEEQSSFPNVSIPCHNEQRDKKKRYTVRCFHSYIYVFIGNVKVDPWGLGSHSFEANTWSNSAICSSENLFCFFLFVFSGLQSDGVCWKTWVVCLQAIRRVW